MWSHTAIYTGPLLYLTYVKLIGNSCQCHILLFADETTLYASHIYFRGSVPISWFLTKAKPNT